MTKIALDLESTLADIGAAFKDEYEARNGVRPDEWTEWNFSNASFSFSEFMEIISSNWKNRPHKIPPEEKGLMQKVHALNQEVDRVDIVTAGERFHKQKRAWLDTHGVIYDDYVQVQEQSDKHGMNYDILVDDCPKHAGALNASQQLFLYGQPYNADTELGPNETRIESLTEAINLVSNV